MADHDTIDLTAFRLLFPMFASDTKYPDAVIQGYYGFAGLYISPWDSWTGGLSGATLDLVLQLLTAHLLYQNWRANKGQQTGPVTGATIDKVTVAILPPPAKDGWQYWLSGSPFGQQLWALLSLQSKGGWSVGGLPERRAIRKVGGTFR